MFFARRAPALSREEFQRTYLTEHARGPVEHFPRMSRYAVNVVDAGWQTRVEHGLADTDVIAEMWFDELGDFLDRARRFDSSETFVAMQQEADGFFGGIVAYHVQQGIQRDYERSWPDGERSPGLKMVYPVVRKAGITREQFAEHWLRKHVPLVLQYMNGISRYVTNVVVAPIGNAPEIDGVVELHYLDPAVMHGPRYNVPEAESVMTEDVAQFLHQTGIAYRTTEHILRT